MGLLWDLIQQGQISNQRDRSTTLEQRIATLERELDDTRRLLNALLQRLETKFSEDLNHDGRIG